MKEGELPEHLGPCNYCGKLLEVLKMGTDWRGRECTTFEVHHHLDLLKPLHELEDVRLARASIRRLAPLFCKHPILEADKPTVHT